MGTGTISVLLELRLLDTPDEEPELGVNTVPVTLGRPVRDPSVRIADEDTKVSVGIVPVTLGGMISVPSARVVDSEDEEADRKVLVHDGWALESEGNGIGIIVKFHDELELADHEAETRIPEDTRVWTVEGTTIEVVLSEAWKLEVETAGVKVKTTLLEGLKLPDPEDEAASEEAGVELLTGSDPDALVSGVCELRTGNNDVAVELIFDDELWFPVKGTETDVKAGTVTMLLGVLELAASSELDELGVPINVEGSDSEDTEVREAPTIELDDVCGVTPGQEIITDVPRRLDSME